MLFLFNLVKKAASIFLILSFVFFGFKETVVVSFYQFNKQYITENYCINKEKPELKCDGKCHMKKMLKKSKESEQESFPEGTLDFKFSTYIKSYFSQKFSLSMTSGNRLLTVYEEDLTGKTGINDIFHPPKSELNKLTI